MRTQPLRQDPHWRQINSAPYTSDSVNGSLHHLPQAYAKGFEDGAYALAETMLALLMSSAPSDAYNMLMEYKAGRARPAHGWSHEPVRG